MSGCAPFCIRPRATCTLAARGHNCCQVQRVANRPAATLVVISLRRSGSSPEVGCWSVVISTPLCSDTQGTLATLQTLRLCQSAAVDDGPWRGFSFFEMKEKRKSSASPSALCIRSLPQPVILWCARVCATGFVSLSASVCVCVIPVVFPVAHRKPSSEKVLSEATAHSGVEIACLDCPDPRKPHLETLFLEERRKPTETCLVEISE